MTLLRKVNRNALQPWSFPRDLQGELGRFFNDFGSNIGTIEEGFVPAIDVRESEDSYRVDIDLPGIKKENIKIEVAEGVLSISGERKSESESNEKDYHRVERSYGSFRRSVSVPGGFQHDAVNAHFEDGVLKVVLPKPEESKPRRVEVKVAE